MVLVALTWSSLDHGPFLSTVNRTASLQPPDGEKGCGWCGDAHTRKFRSGLPIQVGRMISEEEGAVLDDKQGQRKITPVFLCPACKFVFYRPSRPIMAIQERHQKDTTPLLPRFATPTAGCFADDCPNAFPLTLQSWTTHVAYQFEKKMQEPRGGTERRSTYQRHSACFRRSRDSNASRCTPKKLPLGRIKSPSGKRQGRREFGGRYLGIRFHS